MREYLPMGIVFIRARPYVRSTSKKNIFKKQKKHADCVRPKSRKKNCTIGYTDTDIHGLSIGIGTDTDTTPRNVSAIPIVSVSVSGIGIDR